MKSSDFIFLTENIILSFFYFSDQTNDSSLPSSKSLSSGDSWGSEEGREYRKRIPPASDDNETSSEEKPDYKCNNQLDNTISEDNDSKLEEGSYNVNNNDSTIDTSINDNDTSTMDVVKDEPSDVRSLNMGDEVDSSLQNSLDSSLQNNLDSSLQNTIWKISDCSVYTKPSWSKTSWEEKQTFTQETKVL